MAPAADRTGDRLRHHRVGHLVEALLDPPQAEPAQRGPEAVDEGRVAQEAESERHMRPDQQLDPPGRLHHVDLVQPQLGVEQVERPICLASRPRGEVRRAVDENARPIEGGAGLRIATNGSGDGHGSNLTRR